MVRLTPSSIVYVVAPHAAQTGGPELLHQLVCQLKKQNINVKIYYYDAKDHNNLQVTDAYKCYAANEDICTNIVDDKNNVIVVPEICTYILYQYENVQKVLWWLSIDNYLSRIEKQKKTFRKLRNLFYRVFCRGKYKKNYIINDNGPQDSDIRHLVQSEYARQYLSSRGLSDVKVLSDYLNGSFLKDIPASSAREDIVLYNPKKGAEISRRLMESAPDIHWVPLQNMTAAQMAETMRRSKVYIDFGEHPGRDRIPREAAICGCCIITGRRGAAHYFEDIPIFDAYKFSEYPGFETDVIARIRDCLANYETIVNDFQGYRKFVVDGEETFVKDMLEVFTFSAL